MSTDEDTQKILWEAVIDIAHIRANHATGYIERKRKAWRTSWTSEDADRLEREAIQQWNADHPALIALWKFQKEHAEALKAPVPSSEDTPAKPFTVIAEHHEATGPFTEGWSWSCANRACGTVSNGHASHADAVNDPQRLAHTCGTEDTPARVWQEGDEIPAHVRSVTGKRTTHSRQAAPQDRGPDGWWAPTTGVISEQRLLAEHGPVSEVPAGGKA